jgi:hypothetical protein
MKTRLSLVLAATTGAAALCACSGYGVTVANKPPVSAFAEPPEQQATVCVFRPHGLGAAVLTPVSDNGSVVGGTEGQSYFCYLAEPGEHQIAVDDAKPAKLTIAAGEHYYLQHIFSRGPDLLQRVDTASAKRLEAHCVYTIMDEAPEGQTAPPAIALARALPTRTDASPATRIAKQSPPAKKTQVATSSR